jgi:nitroimidazol reductase NimA-like FMN-containing flavoprotein (pyridoxamine 5'-phosphate oxidase superfamily)
MDELEVLPEDACAALLRQHGVGRVALVVDDYPVIVPVNYRVVDVTGAPVIVLRTRPGNVIDKGGERVALQIDGFDTVHRSGWSVLARGLMHHIDDAAIAELRDALDPDTWIATGRDSWLAIERLKLSGRRLRGPEPQWAFHLRGYL